MYNKTFDPLEFLSSIKIKEFHVQPTTFLKHNHIILLVIKDFNNIKKYLKAAYFMKDCRISEPRRVWGYKYYMIENNNSVPICLVRNSNFIKKRSRYYGKKFKRD